MHLTPRESEKLLLFLAGELAEKRKARGLKLNHPESLALISSRLQEAARDGRSVADLMQYGQNGMVSGNKYGMILQWLTLCIAVKSQYCSASPQK